MGKHHIHKALQVALEGLGTFKFSVAMLHWPGDIESGKLMHGKPPPSCVLHLENGTSSWERCRDESYAALLEEQKIGRVDVVGVSNFALRHLDQLGCRAHPTSCTPDGDASFLAQRCFIGPEQAGQHASHGLWVPWWSSH